LLPTRALTSLSRAPLLHAVTEPTSEMVVMGADGMTVVSGHFGIGDFGSQIPSGQRYCRA
jgi:hypothetical protein